MSGAPDDQELKNNHTLDVNLSLTIVISLCAIGSLMKTTDCGLPDDTSFNASHAKNFSSTPASASNPSNQTLGFILAVYEDPFFFIISLVIVGISVFNAVFRRHVGSLEIPTSFWGNKPYRGIQVTIAKIWQNPVQDLFVRVAN